MLPFIPMLKPAFNLKKKEADIKSSTDIKNNLDMIVNKSFDKSKSSSDKNNKSIINITNL
jgi:hypothetical protein